MWLFKLNRVGVLIALVVAVGRLAVAGETQRVLRVDYISPLLLQNITNEPPLCRPLPPPAEIFLRAPSRSLTSAQRWDQFEAEFGIHDRATSPIKSSLQQAKYQLDRALFWGNELAKTVERSLEWDFSLNRLTEPSSAPSSSFRQPPSNPFLATLRGARLKSKITLKLTDTPAFSLRLDLPLGE